jgi:pSer/pThr/pTyr-binding forkhead associated (FHA) protein
MENNTNELLVVAGPFQGRRFAVPAEGIRLGRSSSCEISIPDPSLSRNQCLFELRDGLVYITDLASANGTEVNGEELGAASRALNLGDRVSAGDSELVLVEAGMEASSSGDSEPVVDLGFSQQNDGESPEVERPAGGSPLRLILWLVLVLVVGGSAAAILLVPMGGGETGSVARPLAPAKLWSVSYEKVEASTKGICRYAIDVDAGGNIRAELDDVPESDRHIKKSAALSGKAREELDRLFSSSELFKLEKEYSGTARPGELNRYELRVVRGSVAFSCVVENATEPEAFKSVRLALETFSQNELGIWAIQYSAEKLTEMSAQARLSADAKWEERDVNYGNLAAALKLYDEAVMDLETVNPKPEDYGELITKRDMVRAELDRRYKDQRFEVDRAVNMGDWERAVRELKILCELVPDNRDPRHAEAAAKLVDAENRIKKGGAK